MTNNLKVDLVAHWKFDEDGSGDGTRFDSHTGGFDFIEVSGDVPAEGSGLINFGINFGSDPVNRISYDDTVGKDFNFGDNSFSVAVWVFESANNANNPYLAKWDSSGSTDACWLLWNRSATASHRFSISSDGTSEETIVEVSNPAGLFSTWQFIAAGYDAVEEEIWISHNGGAKTTQAHTGGAFADAVVDLTAGWFQGSSMLMGSQSQDESAIWSKVLTDEDIDALYNSGAGLAFSEWTSGADTGAMFMVL